MSHRWIGPMLFTFLGLTSSVALAGPNDCPDAVPESMAQRRTMAKDWFSRAETLEKARDTPAAIKAYACSMKMVPHAFTAYNLARVAEETGDLEMALGAYRAYLTLNPGAADTAQVEMRIRSLEDRIAAVRSSDTPKEVTPAPTPTPEPAEPTVTPTPSQQLIEAASERSRDEQPPARMGTAEWVIAGGGVAALVGGIVMNMSARGKMNECREMNEKGMRAEALDLCDAAKPRAYASYGLFGVAAVAAIVDTVLILNKPNSSENVGVALLPGGLALRASIRF